MRPDFDSVRDLGQIPGIFEWVFNPNIEVSTKCALAIHRVLARQTSFKNKAFYSSLRNLSLKRTDVQKFDVFDEPVKLSLLCIASMNNNGYVREEALNGLLANSNKFTFPFILFRLADWVPAIRSKAEKAFNDVLCKEEPEFLITNHKLIDWLLKVERSDLRHIHNEITKFIFSDKNIERIIASLDKYSDGDRFFVFKNLIRKNKSQSTIVEEMLSDKHHLIRLLAIRNFEQINDPDIIKRLFRDRSQKIRQYAVDKVSRDQIDLFEGELYQLLFDSSASVRATARLKLNMVRGYDFLRIYRDALCAKPSVGCIMGLAEVGIKTDIEIVEEFVKSKHVRIRAASLFAISLLDYGKAKKLAFDLLNDESNSVKKTCCKIIEKELTHSDIDRLRGIYELGQYGTKIFVLRIISKYGGWSIAGDFLKGILQPDDKVKQTSYALLRGWHRYSARLGTTQHAADKQYVMDLYNAGQFHKMKLPPDIASIVNEIPFIFDPGRND